MCYHDFFAFKYIFYGLKGTVSDDIMWYHFADHHDIGSEVLVDSEDVEDSDVPEDDVNAVDDTSIAHGGLVLQTQQQPQQEDGDGHQVCDVPVVLQPHVDLLLQLPWLRHQDLGTVHEDTAASH